MKRALVSLVGEERVREMHDCIQDPIHHAEGDVLTHTLMVHNALTSSKEWASYLAFDKEVLSLTALLHDVEKPSTREVESDGSITHRGHSRKGAKTARIVLDVHGYPFEVTKEVHFLIAYHGLPFWAIEREDCDVRIIEASLDCRLDLLYAFAKADLEGRICSDHDDCLLRIDLFKERAIELGCFEKPFEFANLREKWAYFHKDSSYPFKGLRSESEDGGFKVVVLSGISGTGKNTWLSKSEYASWPVVELDQIRKELGVSHNDEAGQGRVQQEAKRLIGFYASKGVSFVINNTCLTRQMRGSFIDQVMSMVETAPYVELVFLHKPLDRVVKDNRSRESRIPDAAIEKQHHILEIPSASEAHIVKYISLSL